MLKNVTCLAIVAVHTAENEPLKVWMIYSVYSIHSLGRGRALHEPGRGRGEVRGAAGLGQGRQAENGTSQGGRQGESRTAADGDGLRRRNHARQRERGLEQDQHLRGTGG